jgi:hypothetical protein
MTPERTGCHVFHFFLSNWLIQIESVSWPFPTAIVVLDVGEDAYEMC